MRISLSPASFPEAEPLAVALAGDALPWWFDPNAGSIQGPLPMASFCDRSLLVTLEAGQVGVLTRSGEIRAVLQAGQHLLRVGGGPDHVDPAARLTVLDTTRPLATHWGEAPTPAAGEPPLTAAGEQPIPPGSAAIAIVDPVRFHAAFLRNAEECGEPFLTRLLGTLVRSHLGRILAGSPALRFPIASSPADAAAARERLACLAPADLNAGLEGYGIACTDLAWNTPDTAGGQTRSPASADPATEDRLSADVRAPGALLPA